MMFLFGFFEFALCFFVTGQLLHQQVDTFDCILKTVQRYRNPQYRQDALHRSRKRSHRARCNPCTLAKVQQFSTPTNNYLSEFDVGKTLENRQQRIKVLGCVDYNTGKRT